VIVMGLIWPFSIRPAFIRDRNRCSAKRLISRGPGSDLASKVSMGLVMSNSPDDRAMPATPHSLSARERESGKEGVGEGIERKCACVREKERECVCVCACV